jgi:hypothetical protein
MFRIDTLSGWFKLSGTCWAAFFILMRFKYFIEGYNEAREQNLRNALFRTKCEDPLYRVELGDYAVHCEDAVRRANMPPFWNGVSMVYNKTTICGDDSCTSIATSLVNNPYSIAVLVLIVLLLPFAIKLWLAVQRLGTLQLANSSQNKLENGTIHIEELEENETNAQPKAVSAIAPTRFNQLRYGIPLNPKQLIANCDHDKHV